MESVKAPPAVVDQLPIASLYVVPWLTDHETVEKRLEAGQSLASSLHVRLDPWLQLLNTPITESKVAVALHVLAVAVPEQGAV